MKVLSAIGALGLACLLNTSAQAQDQELPDPQTTNTLFDGVGFRAEIPPDWEGWESSSGQVYFMDLTHANPMGLLRGHVRLAVTASGQATPDMMRDGLMGNFTPMMEQEGRQVTKSEVATRMIDGVERTGIRIHWSAKQGGESTYQQEAFSWQDGDWLIGVSARGILSPGKDRADSDPVLNSLKLIPFNPQALRKIRLGAHSLRVPVMTPTERARDGGNITVRLAWPPGSIELATAPNTDHVLAEVRAAQSLKDHKKRAAATSLSVPRSIYRWFGAGLIEGLQYRAAQPGGNGEVDVRMWMIPSKSSVVAVSFALADERYRSALQAELQRVWNSLEVVDREVRLARFEADGLTMLYDPMFRFRHEVEETGRHLILDPHGSETEFSIQIDSSISPEDLAATMDARLLQGIKIDPTMATPKPESVGGTFLGEQSGRAVSYARSGRQYEHYLFGASLGKHSALASMRTQDQDAEDDLWTLANLLHGVERVSQGPRTVTAKAFRFTYPAVAWSMHLQPENGGQHSVMLKQGEASIRISSRPDRADRGFSGFGGGSKDRNPASYLAQRAAERWKEIRIADDFAHFEVTENLSYTKSFAGSFAAVRTYERHQDGRGDAVTLLLFATAWEVVEVHVITPLDAPQSQVAAIDAILASVEGTSQLTHSKMNPSEVTTHGFVATIPPGFWARTDARAEGAHLLVIPEGSHDASLRLTVVDSDASGGDFLAVGNLRIRVEKEGNPKALANCAPAFDAILGSLRLESE